MKEQLKNKFQDQTTWRGVDCEPLEGRVSVTVPEESFTIKELFERHAKGLMTDVQLGRKDGRYYFNPDGSDDDFNAPDVEKLRDADLVDQQEFMEQTARRTKAYGEAMKKQKEAVKPPKVEETNEPPQTAK